MCLMATIGINNGFAMDNVSDEALPTSASSLPVVTAYTEGSPEEKMNDDESSEEYFLPALSIPTPASSRTLTATPNETIYYDEDKKALFSKCKDSENLYFFTIRDIETHIIESDLQALVLQEIIENCKFKFSSHMVDICLDGITVGDLRKAVKQKEGGEEYVSLIEHFIKEINDNQGNIRRFDIKSQYAEGLEKKIKELEHASREHEKQKEWKQREYDEQIQRFQELLEKKEAEAAEKEKQNQGLQNQLQEQKRRHDAIAEKSNEYYNSWVETKNKLMEEKTNVENQNQVIGDLKNQNTQLNDLSRSQNSEISDLKKVLDDNKNAMLESLEHYKMAANILRSQMTTNLSGDGSNNA